MREFSSALELVTAPNAPQEVHTKTEDARPLALAHHDAASPRGDSMYPPFVKQQDRTCTAGGGWAESRGSKAGQDTSVVRRRLLDGQVQRLENLKEGANRGQLVEGYPWACLGADMAFPMISMVHACTRNL